MTNPPWDSFENRLKALEIAVGVFSHITDAELVDPHYPNILSLIPRTLEDFRKSVDSVFKAAGLEKVEW